MKNIFSTYIFPLKDGLNIIIFEIAFLLSLFFLYTFLHALIFLLLFIILLILISLTINFFRNPERKIKYKPNLIYAPADGVVTSIDFVHEKKYLKAKCYRIKIFMNIFNVHRNRVPCSGLVELVQYKKGKMAAAFKEVEDSNEQFVVVLKTKKGLILFKQIAGLIARRIVCHLRKGDHVKVGDIFGMIKFGSAIVIYMPAKVKILLKRIDKVKAGLSPLGMMY